MSADVVTLVELTGYTDASTSQTYCYSTRPYCTWPTDTPANAYYDPIVADAGFFTRRLFADGESGIRANPRAEVAFGALTLNNISGALDSIFDGRSVGFRERQIRILQVAAGASYSTATVVLRGAISQTPFTSRQVVTIYIKDRLYELNSPHSTTTFAGNNSLPNGLEGVGDLLGKVKPRIYGKVLAYAPPCVNTSRQIYQVSTRAIQSLTAYDGGVAFTAGADYTSQSDMETNAPSAGQVRVWPAGGMLRLNSRPTLQLTCDVIGDTSGNSTVAQVIKAMALDRGLAAGDISASDVAALDALNSAVVGIAVDDSSTTVDLMDKVARSAGVTYGFDQLGVLRMSRFDVPAGSSAFVVAKWNTGSLEQAAVGEDVPTLDVRVKYARYWQPLQTNQLAGAITGAQASDLTQQWRVSQYTGTISPNPYKRTQIAERETLLTAKADADAEAQRLYNITNVTRRTHIAKNVFLDSINGSGVDILGSCPELRWDRYGFDPDVGTLRRVTAMTYYFSARQCDLTLWGA